MVKLQDFSTVHHRSKSDGATVAISLNDAQRAFLGDPKKVSVFVHVHENGVGDILGVYIGLRAHPEGYEVNEKRPDNPTAEIHIALNILDLEPRNRRKGGRLKAFKQHTENGAPVLAMDVSHWIDRQSEQLTIFGNRDRLLLPGKRGTVDTDPIVWLLTDR